MVTMSYSRKSRRLAISSSGIGAGNRARLLQHVLGKLMRDVMRADQNLDVDSEIVRTPQNLDHAAGGPVAVVAVIDDLGGDDHAVQVFFRMHFHRPRAHAVDGHAAGRNRHALGNLDPLADALVVRDHIIAAPAHAKLAHDAAVRPLHHLDDFAVRAPVALQALDAERHAVAVHGAVGVFFAQVDVAL